MKLYLTRPIIIYIIINMCNQVWTIWCNKMCHILRRRCRQTTGGCQIWTGSKTRSNSQASPYGFIRVRLPWSTSRKKIRVHVLAYLINNIEKRNSILGDRNFDISHLCHQSLCTQILHLSPEPRCINNGRRFCNSNKVCHGHGYYGKCVFPAD